MERLRVVLEAYLARLASQRVILVAFLLALLGLLAGLFLVARVAEVRGATGIEFVGTVRALGWRRGSTFFELVMLVLSITLGTTLVYEDVKNGRLFSYLARPISRQGLFVTHFAGAALLLLVLEAIRSTTWIGSVVLVGGGVDRAQLLAVAGLITRDWLLLSLFAATGAAMNPLYAVATGLGIIMITRGAFGTTLEGSLRLVCDSLGWMLPLIGRQDSIVDVLIGAPTPISLVAEAVVYQAAWCAFLVWLGAQVFARLDLR